MQRAEKFGYGFLLLGVPLAYLAGSGPLGMAVSGIIGVGFLIAGHLDKRETDADSLVSLGLGWATNEPKLKPKIRPHLRCANVMSTRISLAGHVAREEVNGDFSFVAIIRNEPVEEGTAIAHDLYANVVFMSGEREIYSGTGAWANNVSNVVTLRAGDEARLILAHIEEYTQTVYAITNSRRAPLPQRARALVQTLERARNIAQFALTGDELIIRVTFVDGSGTWLGRFNFQYIYRNGDLSITLL